MTHSESTLDDPSIAMEISSPSLLHLILLNFLDFAFKRRKFRRGQRRTFRDEKFGDCSKEIRLHALKSFQNILFIEPIL